MSVTPKDVLGLERPTEGELDGPWIRGSLQVAVESGKAQIVSTDTNQNRLRRPGSVEMLFKYLCRAREWFLGNNEHLSLIHI